MTWSSFILSSIQCIIQLVMHAHEKNLLNWKNVLFSKGGSVISFGNKQHESILIWTQHNMWFLKVALGAVLHLLTVHKQKTACAYSWLHTGSAIQCLGWSVKWSARWKTHITPWKCYLRGNESINTLQRERPCQFIITPQNVSKVLFSKKFDFFQQTSCESQLTSVCKGGLNCSEKVDGKSDKEDGLIPSKISLAGESNL